MLEGLGWRAYVPFLWSALGLPEHHPALISRGPLTSRPRSNASSRHSRCCDDEASRVTFRQADRLACRLRRQSPIRRSCRAAQYWLDGLYERLDAEVFVDCGAYDGDTLLGFLECWPDFVAYHAYEPDPQNVSRLRQRVRGLAGDVAERVIIRGAATSDATGQVCFSARGTAAASPVTARLSCPP